MSQACAKTSPMTAKEVVHHFKDRAIFFKIVLTPWVKFNPVST